MSVISNVWATVNRYGLKYEIDLTYYIKNEFWSYLKLIVTLLSGLALSIAFTRLSTKEVYGNFNYIISIVAIVSLFSLPGMNNAIMRTSSRGFDGSYLKAVRTSFVWSIAGSIFLLVLGGLIYHSRPEIGICLMLFSVFFAFIYAPNTYDSFLIGKRRFDISAIYACLFGLIKSLVLIGILFVYPYDIVYIIIGYALINAILTSYFYVRSLKYIENNDDDGDSIKYGYFLTLNNVVGTIANNIDKIIIAMFLGVSDLALYSVAIAIPTNIKDLSKTAIAPITPKLCLDEITMGNVINKIKPFIPTIIVLSIVFGILYIWFIDDVMLLLYGSDYSASGPYAQILLLMILFSIPNIFMGSFIIAKKCKKSIFWGYQLFPVVRLGVMFGFTFLWGVYGALWGLNLCVIIQMIFMAIGLFFDRRDDSATC